jgi:Flp pilus assembly protein TadG
MRAISIKRRKGQQGNSLLEFALFSTVLLMMTLGVTDLGRVFNMGNTALAAAEYAAKWGVLSPAHYSSPTEMYNRAMENMAGYAGATATSSTTCRCSFSSTDTIDCASTCSTGTKMTYVQVNTSIPFRSISGLPWVPVTTITGKFIARTE